MTAETDRNAAKPGQGDAFPGNAAWLSRHRPEAILEPEFAIVDPHHHLWQRQEHHYLPPDLLDDLSGGHHVVGTVFVECGASYGTQGPPELRPVGETEFVSGLAAASAGGRRAGEGICAGIVGFADLTLGGHVKAVLEAHLAAGQGRFRGIRHAAAWDASAEVRKSHAKPPRGLLGDRAFRAGFAELAPLGLSFDAWLYHPQIGELDDLARAFPGTTVVLDHVGGPLGCGPYAGRRDEVFAAWRSAIRRLAESPNVVVKLGGLGMRIGPFDFYRRETPPTSADLAAAWRPYVETCLAAFGPDRCMFESNFPVDKITCSYAVLWNAFKLLAAEGSASEKAALFSRTAARVYGLELSRGAARAQDSPSP